MNQLTNANKSGTQSFMTLGDVREVIRRRADELGSSAALARELGVSRSYVTSVLKGRKRPSDRMLDEFGVEQVVQYRMVEKA